MNGIGEKLHSYLWLKVYTSGMARAFGIHRKIPDWTDMRKDVMSKITPFDQRLIPACVAHATASLMQIEWYRRTGRIIRFSPRFLDIISWPESADVGAWRDPIVVMKLSTRVGCCTEELLPNDTTLPLQQYRDKSLITKAMYAEAAKYRMSNLGLAPEKLFDSRDGAA